MASTTTQEQERKDAGALDAPTHVIAKVSPSPTRRSRSSVVVSRTREITRSRALASHHRG